MGDLNIDKDYLDEQFVNKINEIDNETLQSLIKLFLENYQTQFNYDQIEGLNNYCKSIFANEVNNEGFIRQVKYMVNKGIYGRINKKYKSELTELGLNPEKVELISELEKQYYENNLNKNERKAKNDLLHVKDFDMFTEMPVHYSDYPVYDGDQENHDIKKQNVFINFKLSEGTNEFNTLVSIDKEKLIGVYEKIEKAQEKLDKLS